MSREHMDERTVLIAERRQLISKSMRLAAQITSAQRTLDRLNAQIAAIDVRLRGGEK